MVSVLLLLLLLLPLSSISAQTDQGTINYGDTITGNLTAEGGDRWYFDGEAGERVSIQLESDDFDSFLELRSPDDELLISDDDGAGDFNSLIAEYELPSSGTFSIIARGYLATARGEYTLALTLVSAPSIPNGSGGGGRFSGGTIRYGQTIDEDLEAGLMDRWSFEGTQGDLIAITLVSDEFDPFLELLDANDDVLTTDDDSGNGINARITRFALPQTGTYTIVVRSFREDESGAYTLTLDLRDNFVTGTLDYDDVQEGELRDGVGEFWAFEGAEGDFVTISLSSDEFDTYVELLSPNGAQLANNDDITDENRNSRLDRVQLPTEGTYIIVVRGYLDTARGNYTVTITSESTILGSSDDPIIVGAIGYGEAVDGNLTTAGGDAWTFDGTGGDVVTISLTSQVFDTVVILKDPNGVAITSDDDSGTLLNSLIENFELRTSGTYTIVVQGVQASDRGTYSVNLDIGDGNDVQDPDDENPIVIGAISRGATVSGTVTTGQGDAWTFEGKAGEVVSISANSDEFDTYAELFDSSGELIAANDDSGSRLNALIEDIELPSDDEYTIVVRSFRPNGRGSYSLILESDTPSVEVTSVSDDTIQATLTASADALPNAVIMTTVEVTNIQPGSTAYCVTVSLESNLYTVMSDKTVLLGAIAGDEGDVAEFEVYLSSSDAGNLHATIEWFAAQGCDSEAQILTATREYNISPQTWTIGVDVYPSCIVEEDVVISMMDSEGAAITVPHIVAGGDAIGTTFELAAQSGTYFAQAQFFCALPSGDVRPHSYSRIIEVDSDGQLFNLGSINVPPDSELPTGE